MEKSIIKEEIFRITLIPKSQEEVKLFEKPISEIKERIDLYFDQVVKEKFGEKAYIKETIVNSNFPYEIVTKISFN